MPSVFELSDHLKLSVEEIKDLMCMYVSHISEIKIGENRDTALIDLLEDETQPPDALLERRFIKDDIRNSLVSCLRCSCCNQYALRHW